MKTRRRQDSGPIVLFAAVHSGLANRLRALIGYQALARVRRRPFALCWWPERACDAGFTDLFEPPDFPLLAEAEARHLLDTGRAELFADPRWFYHIRQDHAPDVAWMRFLAETRASLAGLRPVAAVRRAVEAFRRGHDLSETLGVHVRLTDNIEAQALFAVRGGGFDARRLSAVEGFIAAIGGAVERSQRSTLAESSPAQLTLAESMLAESMPGQSSRQQSSRPQSLLAEASLPLSTPVLLATDNLAFERRCREMFGDALLVYPKRYRFEWPPTTEGTADGVADGDGAGDRAVNAAGAVAGCGATLPSPHGELRTTAVADALIELLLLGACRSVLGTYFSSFSKLAAVWGEVDYLEMAGTRPAPHPETSRVIAGLRLLRASASTGTSAGQRSQGEPADARRGGDGNGDRDDDDDDTAEGDGGSSRRGVKA